LKKYPPQINYQFDLLVYLNTSHLGKEKKVVNFYTN